MIETLGRALPLVLAATGITLAVANAQTTLPWPTGPSGPSEPAPMTAAPSPMMAPSMPQQAAPNQAFQQQCLNEFNQLRTAAEKLAAATRAAGERKAPREEMCKHIQAYAVAEAKWVKFTVDNVTKCGIPPQIPKQLREAHSHTLVARKNICSAGPAGPAAPTLSDALGTSRLPVPDGSQSGSGTLDTLTGNAIAR